MNNIEESLIQENNYFSEKYKKIVVCKTIFFGVIFILGIVYFLCK